MPALYCCCRFLCNWNFYFVFVAVVVLSSFLFQLLPHYLIQSQWDTYPHCFCFLPLIYVSPPPIRFLYFCVTFWHTNKCICHHMYSTVSPILFFCLISVFFFVQFLFMFSRDYRVCCFSFFPYFVCLCVFAMLKLSGKASRISTSGLSVLEVFQFKRAETVMCKDQSELIPFRSCHLIGFQLVRI